MQLGSSREVLESGAATKRGPTKPGRWRSGGAPCPAMAGAVLCPEATPLTDVEGVEVGRTTGTAAAKPWERGRTPHTRGDNHGSPTA